MHFPQNNENAHPQADWDKITYFSRKIVNIKVGRVERRRAGTG